MKNNTRYSAWQCGKHERKGISHLGPNIYIRGCHPIRSRGSFSLLECLRPFPHMCSQKVQGPFHIFVARKCRALSTYLLLESVRPFPHWVPTRIRGCHQKQARRLIFIAREFKTLPHGSQHWSQHMYMGAITIGQEAHFSLLEKG